MRTEFWNTKTAPLHTLTRHQLARLRGTFATRIGAIETFVRWPALLASLHATLREINAEIARR
ncbi:MAG: hypothetical protein ACRCYZ_06780 [Alphaproteobacteria bacterium]